MKCNSMNWIVAYRWSWRFGRSRTSIELRLPSRISWSISSTLAEVASCNPRRICWEPLSRTFLTEEEVSARKKIYRDYGANPLLWATSEVWGNSGIVLSHGCGTATT